MDIFPVLKNNHPPYRRQMVVLRFDEVVYQ